MKTQMMTEKKRNNAKAKFVQREVSCAFCQGTGKDPFPGTWPKGICQICRGRKKNAFFFSPLREKLKRCPFCQGGGIHPYSRMSCTVCKGKGWVVTEKASFTCPICKGKGREEEKAFECTRCGGKGRVIVI